MSSDFKVDILMNTAKGFHQEKAGLEQKLRGLRVKRSSLEKSREILKTKQTQIKEINSKMNETMKVAEHKVMETQAQLEIQQKSVSQKSAKVASLESEISRAKTERMNDTIQFENLLSDLTLKFQDAKSRYKDENMSQEITANNICLSECKEDVDSVTEQRGKLAKQMERLTIESGNRISSNLEKYLDLITLDLD